MAQWLRILLLTASLLACPINCMGVLLGGRTSDASTADRGEGKCQCCSGPATAGEELPDPLSPDAPDSCSCLSCLCHGAVLSGHGSDGASESPVFVAAPVVVSNDYSLVVLCEGPPFHLGAPPLSGRLARILHQSLLL